MRKILFKAKRKDNGEWVRGGTIVQFLDNGIRSFYMPQFNEKCDCTHDDATDDILGFENCRFYKIDPDTICQYTGLTDKNGNLIWENDVVFVADDEGRSGQVDTGVGEIDFLEGLWYIGGRVQNSLYDINKCFQIEIIGNIFDNPELLNGGE